MTKKNNDGPLVVLLGFTFIVAIVAVIFVLAGLITLLAWNFGVVAAVATFGGSVGKIGLVTAICINLAVGVIGRIFRGTPATQASAKS